MIRVVLPQNLGILANVGREVQFDLPAPVTLGDVLNAIEARYPMLKGTIRDQNNKERRAFIRFFACEQDLSLEPLETVLPEAVVKGEQRFFVVGAMSGG